MTLAAIRSSAITDSPLARWDARWKLAGVVVLAVVVAAVRSPVVAAVGFLVAVAVALLARISVSRIGSRLALLALGVLPFVIVGPFILDANGPGWDVGPLHVSLRGLEVAAAVACRCLAVGTLGLALASSAPIPTTFAAARSLGVPAALVLVGQMTYRYAVLLAEEARRLRVAARVRGFRARATSHGYRTLGHLAGAVLVHGGERGERVSAAMAARGFDGTPRSLTTFRTTIWDVIGFALTILVSAALLAWDISG